MLTALITWSGHCLNEHCPKPDEFKIQTTKNVVAFFQCGACFTRHSLAISGDTPPKIVFQIRRTELGLFEGPLPKDAPPIKD